MNDDTYEFRLRFHGTEHRITLTAQAGTPTMEIVKAFDSAHFILSKCDPDHSLWDVLNRTCAQNGWSWALAKEPTYIAFD